MSSKKKHSLFSVISSVLCVSLMALSANNHARIKCWENSDGIRECGEKVPPEYAQKGHKEISKHGITVGKSERAKTEEERREEARLEKLRLEEDAKKAERLMQDKVLLDTFSNTEDIQLAADGKVSNIDSTVNLVKKHNKRIQADLDKRKITIENQKKAGRSPSEKLLGDIQSLEEQIKKNNEFILEKQTERKQVKEEYEWRVKRFIKLTGKKSK